MAAEMQQLVDMGFAEADVRRVFQQVGGNVEQAVERLLSGGGGDDQTLQLPVANRREVEEVQDPFQLRGANSLPNSLGTEAHSNLSSQDGVKIMDTNKLGTLAGEDSDLSAALEMSMREQRNEQSRAAPVCETLPKGALADEACSRERDLPCGLRNIGNTCYVNSFLQTLMHIDELRERILRFRSPSEQVPLQGLPEPELEPAQSGGREAANAQRREHCIRLAAELRHLFAHGLFTMRTCIDPTKLLNELVDEKGEKLPIGSQEDVGEFMLKFLERLEEGLRAGSFIDCEEPTPVDVLKSPDDALKVAKNPPADKAEKPSLLQSLFFGQQVQVFSYCEKAEGLTADSSISAVAEPPGPQAVGSSSQASGGLVVSEERGEFLQIFLDVKHKDLYKAWEAAYSTQVEYTTPSGSSTEANTNLWIERLPKLLSFQLQRVVFDSEKKVQVKLDEPFEFDLTIHVDRFLQPNRQAAQEAAAKVRELRERMEELSKALSGFQEYKGRPGLSITDLLGLASECVQENAQACAASAESSGPRLELCNPENVVAAGLPQVDKSIMTDLQSAAPSAVHILRSLRESCLAQEAVLKAEIDRLTVEIGEAHRDLRRFPYELHAIWVHQGIAGSGHYWAYVRDWQSDSRWIRYDDAQVSLVTWEDVRTASVGQAGSNTSAYVLFYVDKAVAMEQSRPRDRAAVLKSAEAVLTDQLVTDIHQDNIRLKEEQEQAEERMADQELRQHAEAIFQDYAGLLYKWEPLKKTGDRNGNPHDPNMRKFLHDPALMNFQLFLYRLLGEQEVWTYLITQSIDSQRQVRKWADDEEGRILYFLAHTLKGQKCYASMLIDVVTSQRPRCEMQPIDLIKRQAQYKIVLLQAHLIDEALQTLKDDGSQLVTTVGQLAFVWARWNLEAEDKFRQNEVLLIMSTLIYNTINFLHRQREARILTEELLRTFQPACEYFLLLLYAVEWPNTWKTPLITRIQTLFPQLAKHPANSQREGVQKDVILQHSLTQARDKLENYEASCPEAGQEFFDRHRLLYGWLMQSDEVVAREYVVSLAPSLSVLSVGSLSA